MVSALEAARKAARKAIEKTYYTGLCSVVERRDVRDEQTKITHKSEVTVIENQPCPLKSWMPQHKPKRRQALRKAQSYFSPRMWKSRQDQRSLWSKTE